MPGHLARNCPRGGMAPMGGFPSARGGYAGGRGGYMGGMMPRVASSGTTCYKCGGPNHFARDCQANAMKCYACGKLGHISRECNTPQGGNLAAAGKVCYKCSQPGHISRDCTASSEESAATNTDGGVGITAPAATAV
ncbi:hypothetical protein KEM54_004341 [Ascosphaera aggregata]|nr:hypothetical protein KEM54_004341 [Ascosphaera aggregata]